MSRADKIRKLCNAIKLYRGTTNPETGKWIRSPQPHKAIQVRIMLMRLGLRIEEIVKVMAKIDAFKYRSDFEEWIKEFQEKKDQTGL